jgi:hypothetical protein
MPSPARVSRHWALALAATTTLGSLVPLACGSEAARGVAKPGPRAGVGGSTGAGGGDLFDAGSNGPPSPDSSDNCGNQVHPIAIKDAPNLVFVLDSSGSMATPDGPGGQTRFTAVHKATVDLVRNLGTLVNVGAAVFPLGGECGTGAFVLDTTPGSPPDADGSDGQTTKAFSTATNHAPTGGTPTAATLTAITPTITALPGKTIVLLATDGGPNCNAGASCGKDKCMANLEGQCDPSTNCCAKGVGSGPVMCLDDVATVGAIDALHKAGVTVYVVGLATSSVYQGVLDAMAEAGGAPLAGEHKYFQVDDLGAQLVEALGAIAGQFVSCDFELDKAPVEPDKTNVWLDQTLLAADPVNGWYWKTKYTTLTLAGDACKAVKTGQVHQVQIVEGCPTQVSK